MELRQIRYALAVRDCGNITRAALQENVSQPTLTQGLRRLEEDLGGKLFARDRAGSQPTALGTRLLPHLEEIVAKADMVSDLAERHVKLKNVPIRFGLADSLGFRYLSQACAAFERENEDVEIEFDIRHVDSLREGLVDASLDIAAASRCDFLRDDFLVDQAYTEKYLVIFHRDHNFSACQELSCRDLEEQVLLDRPNCEMRDKLLAELNLKNVNIYAALRANNYAWMLSQVRDKVGVAVVPESLVGDCPEDVSFRPLCDVSLERDIGLIRHAQQPTHPITEKLRLSLKKRLKSISQSPSAEQP